MPADHDRPGPAAPEPDQAARMRRRRRRILVPAAWSVYGALYVAIFASRGQSIEALAALIITIAIGIGLAVEMSRPQAQDQRLLGWEHDERHQVIHLHAAALTGYVAAAAALGLGLAEFALGHSSVIWPMNALGGLILAYSVAVAFYSRRL